MAYRAGSDPDAPLLAELIARAPRLPLAGGDGDAGEDDVQLAEAELGFTLPPLLRRIYVEVCDGGIGPAGGIVPLRGVVSTYAAWRAAEWPEQLVPICDIGGGEWWYLDCRSDDGPLVILITHSDEPLVEEFGNTGLTLRAWLRAWLEGVDPNDLVFEPGDRVMRMNPFTKNVEERSARGKFKGSSWP